MILSTESVRKLMFAPQVKPENRITITPILDWGSQAKAGQSAIDVRLGQRFSVPRRTKVASLDHLSEANRQNMTLYKEDYHILLGDYFVLHPRQFILGQTLEWIRLPRNYAAYVIGRSSWGRDGLVVATAIGVHPSYAGVLTLEITNLGEIPVRLYPGLTIAQLFIHEVEISQGIQPIPSSFAGSTGPDTGNAAGSDSEIIRAIAEERGFTIN